MPKQMILTSANGMTLYTANKYVNEDIEIVLDAETQKLLKPENIKKDVKILNVTGTHTDFLEEACNNTLINYNSDNIQVVRRYLFYENTRLTSVSLPNADSIWQNAFQGCIGLNFINIPKVTYVGEYAFEECSSLVDIDLSLATNVGAYSFQNCTSLTNVNIDSADKIYDYTFNNCHNLTNITANTATLIASNVFQYCKNLTNVSFNNVKVLGQCAFGDCEKLTSASFSVLTNIYDYAFQNCSQLTDIYIGSEQAVWLDNVNAFEGITGKVTLHVKSAYVDEYANATNWSSLVAEEKIVVVGDYND